MGKFGVQDFAPAKCSRGIAKIDYTEVVDGCQRFKYKSFIGSRQINQLTLQKCQPARQVIKVRLDWHGYTLLELRLQ
jgi:hypothetical protein